MRRESDGEKTRQVLDWYLKAARDIAAAKNDLIPEDPFTESAVFHAQQAAEKAIKGFLAWHDRGFRKTHEIRELASQVIEIDPTLEILLKRASSLTPYATVFRYPGETENPEAGEAQDAIRLAEEVVSTLQSKITIFRRKGKK